MNVGWYVPRPRPVQAVQITEENAQEVAEWCGGKYFPDSFLDRGHIQFVDAYGKVRNIDMGWWIYRQEASDGFQASSDEWFKMGYQPEQMCGDCNTPIRTHETLCD